MGSFERDKIDQQIQRRRTRIAEIQEQKRDAGNAGDTWRAMQSHAQLTQELRILGELQAGRQQTFTADERPGSSRGSYFESPQSSTPPAPKGQIEVSLTAGEV